MKGRLWAVGAVAALVTLTACGSNSSSSAPPSGGSGSSSTTTSSSQIKLMSTGIGTVLATSSGRTVYWFAIDTPSESKCNAACVTFWPPVKGPVTAAPGSTLPGTFGTITRSDGTVQATYMGHPLYTYSGDSAAGQTNGNGLNTAGGLWFAMTPSGAKPGHASPSPSSSSSGGGGGYGY